MFRILMLALLATFATIANPLIATTQESQSSVWTGTLNANGQKLRLEIQITTNEKKSSGQLTSLDQGNTKLDLDEVKTTKAKLSFSIPKIGAKFSGKYSDDKKSVVGTFQQGGAKLSLTLVNSDGNDNAEKPSKEKLESAWIGKLDMGVMNPVMQFRIVTKENGETGAYFDSITEGMTGFAATHSLKDGKLEFKVGKIRLTYDGKLNAAGDEAEGTWSQGGRALPLKLKRSDTEYDNLNVWENRPQRPVAPFPYDAEEVTFENKVDGLTLAGTLTVPKKPGRHPVVILISGSGPQDRDESLMEHKPFLVLADYLTRRGIAVLRYDDRGTAKSTGKFGPATTEDFARDASAAVDFLKQHSKINPKEIGLAGHSEGGLIAPMVVGLRDDVAFVALLAATGVDGVTISISQGEAMLRAAGTSEDSIKVELAASRAVIDVVIKAGKGENFDSALDNAIETVIKEMPEADQEEGGNKLREGIKIQKKRLTSNWMRFFLSYDPRPALTKIECPVLAITGSKDLQVLPDLNVPEIRKALIAGGNKDFEIVELEGLNHLFQECNTGAMDEYAGIQETFNPKALKRIGDWMVGHTTVIE